MRYRAIGISAVVVLAAVAVLMQTPSSVNAQTVGTTAGVIVDAQGVLDVKTYADPGGQLTRQRIAAAKTALAPEVLAASKLRKVSLNRLEKAIQDRGGAPTDEMRYLAGLLRVEYVFFYPETKDIVVAGPAEGWMTDIAGRVVGVNSSRPVVQLQDLVVALRAFPPGHSAANFIGCSIDPTPEGLAAMQAFLRQIGSRATPADTRMIVNGLRTSLGLQEVSINGVSPKSHFAQVMVEADYRMKLIGIGLEQPPVRLTSYVDRANPAQVSRNAMQRWYFMPDYQCVRVTDDGLAMRLEGDGVKLVGEDEVVLAGGQRKAASTGNKASQAFVNMFTKKYPELANRSPVYAELRNLIDLSIAAAFIQQEDYFAKADWKMEFFGNESSFAVETHNVPKMVATAVNAIWKGSRLMTPVGGGVSIYARKALESGNVQKDEDGQVTKAHQQVKIDLPADRWWWD